MIQKIDKWGNSLGLRLPKNMAAQLSLNEGSTVVVTIEKNAMILRPQKKSYQSLSQLLEHITPQNTHSNISWGKPRGKEIW